MSPLVTLPLKCRHLRIGEGIEVKKDDEGELGGATIMKRGNMGA